MESNVPKRPLGELTVSFDQLRKPVRESDRRSGPYPYYGASGVIDRVDAYIFDGDYLLVAEDGENLRTNQTPIAFMAKGKFWVNNHAHVLQGNTATDTRYLMYALQAADIAAYLTGSAMPKLTASNLSRILVPAPKLVRQRAVAHVLGVLDDKIELNRRMNETLEAIARTMFKSWFIDFDPVRAKAEGRDTGLPKHIGDLFPDHFEDSELGEIPARWRVHGLDDVADFVNGLVLQKYPPSAEDYLPVIKIAQIRKGNTEGADLCSAKIPNEYIISDGDVLFSWSGSLEVEIWAAGKGALNQHIFKVSSKNFSKWFYYLWIKHHLCHFRHIAESKATTMGHIQRRHLRDAKVLVPPTEIFRVMDTVFTPIIDRSISAMLQSHTIATIRDVLLPKLISGEVRVPVES